MAVAKPVVREVSGDCWQGNAPWYHAMLVNDWSACGAAGGIYALYHEMEEKDAHLFATLQTRKNALLACPWKVVPGDDSAPAREAARLVEDNLRRLPSLSGVLFHLMDALAKGFAVAEILWQVDGDTGRVQAADIKARYPGDFAVDADANLYLLQRGSSRSAIGLNPHHTDARHLLPRPGESMVPATAGVAMPGRKFLNFTFQGNGCTPYGAALCTKAYWYYWLKKNTLKHWALFNEKFGSPTAVARYSSTVTDDELQRLEELMRSLPRDSGVMLPEGVALEFLEARRSSGMNTYRELADWCNDEISKIVLGQTLTTTEGRRTGSLALGKVHELVRRDYLASDAAALGDVMSAQLARWLTDFNFGTAVASPRVMFDVAPPEQFEAELNIDRELIRMGVPLPAAYFYERYRRPVPATDERTLRYDDANLYQYHLLHGVLTVNEVRASLGLQPVSWGNVPTGGQSAKTPPGGGAREPDPAEDADDARESGGRESAQDRRTA